MSRSQFENYYGVDLSTDAGKWQAAKAMAQRPTENVIRQFAGAMGAVFMGMGGNTAYLITVLKPAVYDSHGNRLADQVNGVVNLSIGVGRSELVIDQQGGPGPRGMTDFTNSNWALTIGGGIFGAMEGATASQGYWLEIGRASCRDRVW